MMTHVFFIIFLFAVGACIGSFLNVVAYRVPAGISLLYPPSRCPDCLTPLAWFDNLPVIGWILLRGKCRYCHKPISPRYPLVEFATGFLYVMYYVLFFIYHAGPAQSVHQAEIDGGWFVGQLHSLIDDWPIYALYMVLISALLAASLIDAELFIIPVGIPWTVAIIGVTGHALIDRPGLPGALVSGPVWLALGGGAAIGLILSIVLLQLKIFPISFPEGDLLEVERKELHQQAEQAAREGTDAPEIPPEYTGAQVRHELRKEMLFLMPPLFFAAGFAGLCVWVPATRHIWQNVAAITWFNALISSVLGALVGGFTVWLTRVLGSYVMGREAMGLGDVHLMLAVGAILGGGASVLTFFFAPFFGLVLALYMFAVHRRRQLPYGPYLSLAAAFVMLFYFPLAAYFQPGLLNLVTMARDMLHGT